MMYCLILCDNRAAVLTKMKQMLRTYQEWHPDAELSILTYSSAKELQTAIKANKIKPDLMLLDAYIPDAAGLEAALQIHSSGCDIPIVFLAMSLGYALSAYEAGAIQYLARPFDKKRLFHVLDNAFLHMKKKNPNYIMVKNGKEEMPILVGDIVFCEAQRNYQLLYLKNEQIRIRMTMEILFQSLCEYSQFIKCGSSYIINLDYVKKIEDTNVFMKTGMQIVIPRAKRAELKKKFLAYIFKE